MIKCDERKPYVFISYAHKDSDIVYKIIEKMCEQGYNVWYDSGIEPGTDWDQNIAMHVKECAYFIAFISERYLDSDNCKDELNYARDLKKERLLVYLEDVELPEGMAMRMNRMQAIWWNKYASSNIDVAYEKLFSASGIEKVKINDSIVAVSESPAENISEKNIGQSQKDADKKAVPVWGWIIGGIAGVALIVALIFGLSSNEEKKFMLPVISSTPSPTPSSMPSSTPDSTPDVTPSSTPKRKPQGGNKSEPTGVPIIEETGDPISMETYEPEIVETNEPVSMETHEPEIVETNKPASVETDESSENMTTSGTDETISE